MRAVQPTDLAVPDGEFVSIVGHSGSGKSTLLSLLGGLAEPDSGSVVVGLIQVAALKTRESADNAVATLKRMDYAAFTFKDGAFWKVRAGPFRSEDAARGALELIRKRLGGKPFVTRAPLP